MSGEEFANLRVGDVVRERQDGSTAKVILEIPPYGRHILTAPRGADHPRRWIGFGTLRRRFEVLESSASESRR